MKYVLLACVALFASASGAQDIDYDPRRATILRPCDEHRYHGRSDDARRCYEPLLSSPNAMIRAEAAWALGDLKLANETFREIAQQSERAVHPRVRWGRLFLQTHQYSDAVELFREALGAFPNDVHAKMGLAGVFAERFEGEARTLVEEVLKQDDQQIEAHLLAARMALEEGQFEPAEESLDRAAQIATKRKLPPLEVFSLRAGMELSRDRNPGPWIDRALEYNPHYGEIYQQLAHFEIMRRRYRQATDLLRRAIDVQPDLWSAHAELGSNLLRLGQLDEARVHLQKAYQGDPYSPTTVNSLRLLDRIDEFELSSTTVPAGGGPQEIKLRLHKQEAPVLRPYALTLAQQSIDVFSRRYGFRLQEPVTVEIYPDHDDFAVRVAALPGIGLLGVTFGYLVAMDSPAGRASGEFHWGSTLWHEMAHVFTLEATDHRVPRWLSEGISVYEEWRTGPTPGVAVPPDTIGALNEGKFLPVSDLDSGFIRPTYPNQVQVSYVQSGLVCLFVEQKWGFEKLAALLKQFTRNVTTAEAISATFDMSPAAFDKEFDTFVRGRFAPLLANLGEFDRQYRAARKAIEEERWGDAVEPARRAASLYPEHAGGDSPNLLLARALDKLDRRDEAISALEAYRAGGGWDPTALRELARWLDEGGRKQEATALLQSLNYADPMNPTQHLSLGDRLLTEEHAEDALLEYHAALALNVHDQAPAYLGAAKALRAMGDRPASRRSVLDALAIAPHYKPAQEFLLQTIEERTKNE
jgi:tetratricopeptide (TPR) repeat protein